MVWHIAILLIKKYPWQPPFYAAFLHFSTLLKNCCFEIPPLSYFPYIASQMKYYLIAGEASGDLHGSNLIKSIKDADSHAVIRAWGGDKMEQAGATVVKHIRDLAFMGFSEVVKNLPTILKNIRFCKKDIQAFDPDVIVLIDYPGFNLRIARWAKSKNYSTAYYISPQIWAWKESRIGSIKTSVDKMLVIFPFEKTFYQKWNYEVEYVGHPLVPVVQKFRESHPEIKRNTHTIALLPGSRKQEIKLKLPVMLEAAKSFPEHSFVVAKAPSIETTFYETFLHKHPNVSLTDNAYMILMQANAALVTSGTATLETALFGVPQIVCYKTSPISYTIGKRLIKLKFICIVNLIMNKEVVKELIQNDLTPANIVRELKSILENKNKRESILQDYAKLQDMLSFQGNASANAAEAIVSMASKTQFHIQAE